MARGAMDLSRAAVARKRVRRDSARSLLPGAALLCRCSLCSVRASLRKRECRAGSIVGCVFDDSCDGCLGSATLVAALLLCSAPTLDAIVRCPAPPPHDFPPAAAQGQQRGDNDGGSGAKKAEGGVEVDTT